MSKLFPKNDQSQGKEGQLQVLTSPLAADNEQFVAANVSEFTVDHLPPELWVRIFNLLKNPKDLSKCWNPESACVWTRVLQSEDFYYKMTLAFVLPYLERQDLISCSSVSKSWNAAVDVWMQNAEDFSSDSRLTYDQRLVIYQSCRDIFELFAFHGRFELSSVRNSGGNIVPSIANPVIFRRVEFYISYDKGIPPALEAANWIEDKHDPLWFVRANLMIFVFHFGHLIHHLHLQFVNEEGFGGIHHIDLIRSCLLRTPNLRVLRISTISDSSNLETRVVKIGGNIFELSWPVLEHLKVLKFGRSTDQEEYACIANFYAPQLVYLQFGFALVKPLVPFAGRFPGLQKIVYVFTDSDSGIEFGNFVQSSQCRLKHLTVLFRTPDDPYEVLHNCAGLTMAANAANATLESLVIGPHKRYVKYNDSSLRQLEELKLPNLKVLDLMDFDYPLLDFLLTVCPALERLSVTPSWPGYDGWKMTADEGDGSLDLYSQHEFWTQLAHIQKVDVEYMADFENVLVDGSRGQIIHRFGERKRCKVYYTRREYEAKLGENYGIDTQLVNQSLLLNEKDGDKID